METFPLVALGFALLLGLVTIALQLRRASPTTLNMRERAWAWWLLLGVGVPALCLPAPGPTLLFGLAAALALKEFLQAMGLPASRVNQWVYLVVPMAFQAVDRQAWAVGAGALVLSAALVLRSQEGRRLVIAGAALTVSGLCSLAWLANAGTQAGNYLVLALVVTQLSDAMQYIVGKKLGRTPLAPRLSPSKTWEGLLGGAGIAVAVGTALAPAWNVKWEVALGLSTLVALLGVGSGLLLSAIKRRLGIKDWGGLLKGHGGVLDRVDSLLLAGPALVALCRVAP